jgi:hypothetical protein
MNDSARSRTAVLAVAVALFSLRSAAPSFLRGAPAPSEYVFVHYGEKTAVAYQWGIWVYGGTLSESGKFQYTEKVFYPRWMPPFSHIQRPPAIPFLTPTKVYEYRSGRLIPGTMMAEGEFVPEQGGREISLERYRPRDDRMIWNLPGYFLRRDHLEMRLKWLAEHMAENPDAYGKEKAKLDAAMAAKK